MISPMKWWFPSHYMMIDSSAIYRYQKNLLLCRTLDIRDTFNYGISGQKKKQKEQNGKLLKELL